MRFFCGSTALTVEGWGVAVTGARVPCSVNENRLGDSGRPGMA